MANSRDNNDDDKPTNHRLPHDPALAAQGLGALHLSSDDLLATAAACAAVAKISRRALAEGETEITAATVAQLYQLAAVWLRVVGGAALTRDALQMERAASDVIREAAMGDLERVRAAGSRAH